jgi:putative transposase
MEVNMPMWHRRPAHVFLPGSFYMVTAGTLHKEHLFCGNERLELLQNSLFTILTDFGWALQSWALFSNHYHFAAKASIDNTLKSAIQRFHSVTARELNRRERKSGRQVWFQYWDTCLSYEKNYLARLNYVNHNPVHHGLVRIASQYPFCSAGWFEQNADPAFRRKVESFGWSRVKVIDDF